MNKYEYSNLVLKVDLLNLALNKDIIKIIIDAIEECLG